jgi:hypothetical protein
LRAYKYAIGALIVENQLPLSLPETDRLRFVIRTGQHIHQHRFDHRFIHHLPVHDCQLHC